MYEDPETTVEVSVIIPTFNRKDVLLMCLQHLKQQTFPYERFEVIIAIDGSTDGTKETVESTSFPFRVRVVEQHNSGPAAARNLGARSGNGQYLLFLDDDIMATPELIAEHLFMHKQFAGSVVVGPTPTPEARQRSALSQWQRDSYQNDIERLNNWGFDAIDHYFCLGANGSLSKDLFIRSGGFDESLHSEGDETELGLRLLDLGATFRWNPKAIGNQYWVKDVDALCITDRKRRVINEVEILRRDARFRVLSRFTDLFAGPWMKLRIRRFMARFPGPINNCTLLLYRAIQILPPSFRLRIESRLLKILWVTTHWETYRKHFGDPFRLAYRFDKKVPILTYHLVRDDLKPSDVVISTPRFRQQMEFLHRNGYSTISLQNWRDWVLFEKPLPEKPVILTFDDGFKDLYENAWQILKKYNFRFTTFVVTGRIGERNTWEGVAQGRIPLLSRNEMNEMVSDGATFESHSRTHPFLRQLSDRELQEEVLLSKDELKSSIGYQAQFFAYPYGDFRARERKAILQNGYLGACTTFQGLNTIRTDLYRLRRINISGRDSMLDFRLKLRYGSGFLNWTNLRQTISLLLLEQFGLSKPQSPLKNLL